MPKYIGKCPNCSNIETINDDINWCYSCHKFTSKDSEIECLKNIISSIYSRHVKNNLSADENEILESIIFNNGYSDPELDLNTLRIITDKAV